MPDLFKPPVPDASRPIVRWNQLYGSSAALALAEAAAADARPWVVVEPDSRSLERRRAELQFFAPAGLRLLSLPDWEVLPYDQFSPHADIVSERLLTLAELPTWRRGILLVTADTLLQRLPPRAYVAGRSFTLAVGDTLALDAFRARLVEAGYASVSQVGGPGEFALHGAPHRRILPGKIGRPLQRRDDGAGLHVETLRRVVGIHSPTTQMAHE